MSIQSNQNTNNEIKSRGTVQMPSVNTQTVQNTSVKTEFFEINLGHKSVFARKWKAKDRKNFKKAIQSDENLDNAIMKALVMNCLENKNVALTQDEIQYILVTIRKHSISDKVKFEYICDECEEKVNLTLNIDDVNSFHYSEWKEYKGIMFGNIPNAKFYNENKELGDDINEIAFHTVSINGNQSMTFDEVINYYEEMDIDEFDDIFEAFLNQTFTLLNKKEVECPHCNNKQVFEFDEIPGFFPDTWLK